MSGFSTHWLALREPFDLAARNENLENAFVECLPKNGALKILDLASGQGSTIVALGSKLDRSQRWTLTDNDPDLLKAAAARFSERDDLNLELKLLDLSKDLQELDFKEYDAITTSAFLDLVAEDFLERLVECVVSAKKPFLASLSYDGRAYCDPADAADEMIRQAMNTHQRTDKGFGSSLGPTAWTSMASLFRQANVKVFTGPSDWRVGQQGAEFQRALLRGWLDAAAEMNLPQGILDSWKARRWAEIDSGQLSILVGHQDLLVLPKETTHHSHNGVL